MDLTQFSTRLPEELVLRLKLYAVKNSMSMQEALRQILEVHLDEKEKN